MRPLLLFFSWEKMGEGKGKEKEKLTHPFLYKYSSNFFY